MRTKLAVSVLTLLAGHALAQPFPGSVTIDLQPVATGLVSPITGTHANDNRFFIVDQTGKILILQNGAILPTPFLDLAATGDLSPLNAGYDEKGLLGLVFHPNYAANGRFFVRYSKQRNGIATEPCFGTGRGCHEEILAEYHVSAGNPNVANPVGTILFRVNKPEFNHNSGDVVFGPDGFLYFAFGDGGGANDDLHLPALPHGPIGNGQNINVPLGKVLRIDVNGAPPYSIPASNPFAAGGGLPEIWCYGLRNPFRFSFDDRAGGTNQMYLTDVGQDQTEELNIGAIGANFGWAIMEGPHCFDPFHTTTPPATCANAGMTMPIASYDHINGGIAIVGGWVYRSAGVPQLQGMYVTGDFSSTFAAPAGRMYYMDSADPLHQLKHLKIGQGGTSSLNMFLKGYGRDQDGELYVMASTVLGPSNTRAQVMKIVACYANCDGSTAAPVLTANDFQCFLNKFAAGDPGANCDLSAIAPVLTANDFQCFLNKYAAGCP